MNLDKIISEAIDCDYIHDYPINGFSIEELEELTERAKRFGVKVELHSEHSNYAQGVLIQVYKWPLPWECDFNNMPKREDSKNA